MQDYEDYTVTVKDYGSPEFIVKINALLTAEYTFQR